MGSDRPVGLLKVYPKGRFSLRPGDGAAPAQPSPRRCRDAFEGPNPASRGVRLALIAPRSNIGFSSELNRWTDMPTMHGHGCP
jgi:hypothetical protein